jgi:hypothetical protein
MPYDIANNWKHGERGDVPSPEYTAWQHMKDRCYNSNNLGYKDYGGRGIIVYELWKKDFSRFLKDMGRKPSNKHSLGRINNNGDYDPLNCTWQVRRQQNQNKRNVKMTMAKAREVRMLFQKGYLCKELAIEFNVTKSCIMHITSNQTWKEGK